MPTRRSRARSFGGGRTNINVDLSPLFAGAESNVIENPEFGKKPGDVPFTYKGDPSELVKQKYKAGNVFAKGRAAELNIEDMLDRIKRERDIKQARSLGELETIEQISRERQLGPIKKKQAQELAAIEILKQAGIIPDEEYERLYKNVINPRKLETKAAEEELATKTAITSGDILASQAKARQAIEPTEQQRAIEQSALELEKTKSERALLPETVKAKRTEFEQIPRAREAEILRNRFFPLTGGLYDIGTSKVVAKPAGFNLSDIMAEHELKKGGTISTPKPTPESTAENIADTASDPLYILIKDKAGNVINKIPKTATQ